MIVFIKKNYLEIIIFPILLLLLGYNLNHFPTFGDESPLIFYGWILKHGGPYGGYVDWMMPLFSYITSYALIIFSDPLFAGRSISFFSAIIGIIGVYLLAGQLYGRKPAIISSVFYAVLPITFFYHRFALRESLIAAAGIYVLLFSYYLIKKESKEWMYILGIAISLTVSIFTKQNTVIFFAFPLLTYISVNNKNRNKLSKVLISYCVTAALIIAVSIPQLNEIATMKTLGIGLFQATFFKRSVLTNLIDNGHSLFEILNLNFGFPFIIVLTYSLNHSIKEKNFYNSFLFLFPIFIMSIYIFTFSENFSHTRYMVPIFLTWYVLSGKALFNLFDVFQKIDSKYIKYILCLTVLIFTLATSLNFIYKYFIDPENTPFATYDRAAHIEGTSAGFGLFEAFDYLENLSKKSPILLVIEPGTGPKNWPYMLFERNPNIKVARWPGFTTTPLSPYINTPAYAVLDDLPWSPGAHYYFKKVNPNAKLIKRYWRPGKKTYIDIMMIEPLSNGHKANSK